MEFNISTFILEIINFIVLVWILKRLLFKPVKAMIEKRHEAIQSQIAKANQVMADAKVLKAQSEQQISNWQNERANKLKELEAEMAKKHVQIDKELEQYKEAEINKVNARIQRELSSQQQNLINQANAKARQFSRGFLSRLASQKLDELLLDILIEDLNLIEASQKQSIAVSMDTDKTIHVASAHPLEPIGRRRLEDALINLFQSHQKLEFEVNESLMSGLLLEIGSYQIKANIRDELKVFFNHEIEQG